MNKEQFLAALRRRLEGLPASETQRSLDFYAESIDDRVEDGMTEAEAVAALGDIDDIAREITGAMPLSTLVRREVSAEKRRGHSALWIVLAIVGFPVWLPLLIAAGAVALSVYIVFWAVIVSFFAVLAALAATGLGLLVYCAAKAVRLGLSAAAMVLGAALACFGLALLLKGPVTALVKALVRLTGRFWRRLKGLFFGRGGREI